MILVNGAAADSIAATDRGLAYGDGVFRTLLIRQGRPRWWPFHYAVLARDCKALGLSCPAEAELAADLGRLAQESAESVAKIVVTRGSGARGYAPPPDARPTRIVSNAPLPQYPPEFARDGITVRLCTVRLSDQPRLAGVKHLNRLENVLARAEWRDPAIPEGLMLDAADSIIGGTMTNLFIVEGQVLITPALWRCGVAGATRERILTAAARHGVACREEAITQDRLRAAGEAMLVNSVIGVWQIAAFDGKTWKPGAFTVRVREWLDEEVG